MSSEVVQPYRWQDDQPLDGCEFAARLQPGMAVDGAPLYQQKGDPDVINVAYVEDLGDDRVRIYDLSGWSTETCADMCMTTMTPELTDLMGFVVLAEQDRLAAGEGGSDD